MVNFVGTPQEFLEFIQGLKAIYGDKVTIAELEIMLEKEKSEKDDYL